MFGNRAHSVQSAEEYDKIIQTIKSQVMVEDLCQAPRHNIFEDIGSTELVQDRIDRLEFNKKIIQGQIELFQKFISELQPQFDDAVTELARLRLKQQQ